MEFLRLQVLEQQNIIDDLSKVQPSVISPAYSHSHINTPQGLLHVQLFAFTQPCRLKLVKCFTIEHKQCSSNNYHEDDIHIKDKDFIFYQVLFHLSGIVIC